MSYYNVSFTKEESLALLSGLEMLFEEYDISHCHPDTKKMLMAAEKIQSKILAIVNKDDVTTGLQ